MQGPVVQSIDSLTSLLMTNSLLAVGKISHNIDISSLLKKCA